MPGDFQLLSVGQVAHLSRYVNAFDNTFGFTASHGFSSCQIVDSLHLYISRGCDKNQAIAVGLNG